VGEAVGTAALAELTGTAIASAPATPAAIVRMRIM
jgi:hypothetical protein